MRALLAAFALSLAALPALAQTYRGYAEQPYTTERKAGDVEIRAYPPRTVAEVIVKGSRVAASQRGFGELFGYITGENAEKGKIAMTVPVAQAETDRGWVIRFFMPDGATRDSLPVPDSAHVAIRRLPAERMLVARFSGRASERRLAAAEAALRSYADANGLPITGAPRLMFYDDPFTMPWNRRNEIAFALGR